MPVARDSDRSESKDPSDVDEGDTDEGGDGTDTEGSPNEGNDSHTYHTMQQSCVTSSIFPFLSFSGSHACGSRQR